MTRNKFEKLTVADVLMKERTDGTGSFPVAIIQGISFNVSDSGNQSFSKRKVHMPLNGLELAEAKSLFPKGSAIEGFKIQQYEVEPYEFTDPETGESIIASKRYRLKPIDEPAEPQKTPAVHRQPASTMEDAIFERKPRSNDLEPQEA